MRLILLLLACVFLQRARAQDWNPAPIADSLQKNAGMVRRMDATELDIESPRKARLHYRRIYTILNSSGDKYAVVYSFYDKFHSLNNITGILYDASGKVLKKIRKTDMEDQNTEGAGIMMSDTRIKFYRFSCHSYPYTISYEEETELNGLFILPQWQPQPSYDIAVEHSSLVVKTPAGYPLRYKQYNYPQDVVITEKKDTKTYSWDCSGRPVVPREPLATPWYWRETRVSLAPGNFEIEGYKGSLYTWADMGKFVGTLFQGQDQLPEEAKKKVHSLVDSLPNEQAKIVALYDFLQRNTHYVGIELGIGGWQPFDATYVYNKRYGDCKALSNYMVALLKEAGIRAASVLIRGGNNDPGIDTGFASSQFNHAIALAFTGRDSVWLECTSSILPAGYLGGFTADRDGLLIDRTGGVLVHTPVYGLQENRLTRTLIGSLDNNGSLQASLRINYTGLEQDALQNLLDRSSKKEMLDRRQQSFGVQNSTITDLHYQTTASTVPAIEETMQLSINHYATVTGSRLMIPLGAFIKRSAALPEDPSPRKEEIDLTTSLQETDSICLQIPPGYEPEGAPLSRNFSASFGSYRYHSDRKGDTLILTCQFRQNKGRYPPSLYPRMVSFFNAIHREGTRQLIFVRKE